jgi:hypothetical protein
MKIAVDDPLRHVHFACPLNTRIVERQALSHPVRPPPATQPQAGDDQKHDERHRSQEIQYEPTHEGSYAPSTLLDPFVIRG